jgi:actin-related protein
VILDTDELELLMLNILTSQFKLEKSDDTPFILTEPAIPQKGYRMKLAELAFEKFDVPELAIINSQVLSLFA